MFNFNVMNRANKDPKLSGNAFKALYFIANKCSLENTNIVEIHNPYLMMILGKKERQVTNITNELVEKGYIRKTIVGTSKNNRGNLYELIEVEVNNTPTETSYICDKNVPLTNSQTKDAKNCYLTESEIYDNAKDAKNCYLTNDSEDTAINDVKYYAKNCTLKNNKKINNNIYNINDQLEDNKNINNILVEDCNNNFNISLEEENEIDQLINNIPTIKETMNNINNQNKETIIPTAIVESNSQVETINNNSNVVLSFDVSISGIKQTINVEYNKIDNLQPVDIFNLFVLYKSQIFDLIPETFVDGYWTKDCYNYYPSRYDFEKIILPESIKRFKLNPTFVTNNSAPAPANAQECPTIVSNVENDKEYQEAQENATEAKTEPLNDVIGILDEERRKQYQEFQDNYNLFMSDVTRENYGMLKKQTDEFYSYCDIDKSEDYWNFFQTQIVDKLAIAESYLNQTLVEEQQERELELEIERINNSRVQTKEIDSFSAIYC